jgi:dTDP-4-amino-4,6-dideoxygalactose transaminase
MSSGHNSFTIPREQFLSLRYLTANTRRSPQEQLHPGAARFFFFWARNALYHALHALHVPRTARVLLPAYLCKAAVEPFKAYGLQVDFYDIQRDCTPDFAQMEAKLHPSTRVVLAVHYFGFPQKIREFREFCHGHNLLLFEDCAHVLRSEAHGHPLGFFGDASVFSYRKFLPMFDGAELLMRSPLEKLTESWRPEPSRFAVQAGKHVAGQALNAASGLAAKILSWGAAAAKSLRRGKQGLVEGEPSPKPAVDNNSASFDEALVCQPITWLSGWILRHSDAATISAKRRENFLFLDKALREIPGITPMFDGLGQGVCPWVYPLFIEGVPNAHLLIRAAGIPAVTWGGVRPDDVSEAEFPGADFLYNNLVFLPLHQNLSAQQLRAMVEVVKTVRVETQ